MKPTPTQQKVIDKLTEVGRSLVNEGGGFWTWDGCPVNAAGHPTWWVTVQTVRAMERKGLLKRDWFSPKAWNDSRSLATPADIEALRTQFGDDHEPPSGWLDQTTFDRAFHRWLELGQPDPLTVTGRVPSKPPLQNITPGTALGKEILKRFTE